MDGFTILDGVVAFVIVLSGILAYARGFVREALAIAGWVVAAIVAFMFTGQAEPLVREIPVVGEMLGGSCELTVLAAFGLTFLVALLLLSVITPLFASLVRRSPLASFDQILGMLFGLIRGVVLVAVALVIYDRVVPASEAAAIVENSRSRMIFDQLKPAIEDQIPEDAPDWLVARYDELTGHCRPNSPRRAPTPAPAEPGTSG
ncbi:MAG: CvpA family protein [Alphaproteobacteria bacterium]|nr:MAG: CvpA family protein [Alphaproteobacteria bacterium]